MLLNAILGNEASFGAGKVNNAELGPDAVAREGEAESLLAVVMARLLIDADMGRNPELVDNDWMQDTILVGSLDAVPLDTDSDEMSSDENNVREDSLKLFEEDTDGD